MKKLILALIVAALAAVITWPLAAADTKPVAEPKAAPARALPFSGKLASVKKPTKTLKVGKEVGGAYREGEDKKLNIIALCLGSKPEAAPKKDAPAI